MGATLQGDTAPHPEDRDGRPQLEVLAEEECWRLLGGHHLGRLALVDAKGPAIRTRWNVVVRGALAEITDPGVLPYTWWG